jgi:murein DD-endopeptidase MepM/ murein hydrolase activator NlpD
VYRGRVDALTIVGIAFLVFIVFNVLSDRGLFLSVSDAFTQPLVISADASGDTASQDQTTSFLAADLQAATPEPQGEATAVPVDDPDALIWPYTNYVLTQGPHGMSYGHMAIDLSAGKGATILSPINGEVTQLFVDQYGNPTLILENSRYKILMLHGDYTVQVGQRLIIGQPVGAESNHGYTLDANGRLCDGRDCGYHTHLNIFDKQLGSNVNPLEVLPR